MDDELLDSLGKSLRSLERDGPALDELIIPRTPSAGENAGKAARRGKSKPPVVVSILDVKLEVLGTLEYWSGKVNAVSPSVDPPEDRSVSGLAEYLRLRLEVVESAPWAAMCADEVIGQARFVSDIVMPPASASDPLPLEIGTSREIASWAQHLGHSVSRSTVQRWERDGVISSELAPDGRVLVQLHEVIAKCKQDQWKSLAQEETA